MAHRFLPVLVAAELILAVRCLAVEWPAPEPRPATPGTAPQDETAPKTKLKTAPSPMRLRAGGVKFAGEAFSRRLDRSSQAPEITIAGVTYFHGGGPDGLVAHDKTAGTQRVYGMFDLAIAGGWYKRQGNDYLPQDIRGLWREGSRLWMGSNGVGVLVFDTQAGTWSRHDMKETPVVGHHVNVCFADADFVFAEYGYHQKVPAAVPSLHVFSTRHDHWLEITAVPSKDALRLGSSDGLLVALGWDHRPLAKQAYVPIRGGVGTPNEISRRPDGSYVLQYGWKDRESSWTQLLVRPADLRAAFDDAGPTELK